MVFNSLTFMVFFGCVLALHSLPLAWTTKKINLLIASYLFYAGEFWGAPAAATVAPPPGGAR